MAGISLSAARQAVKDTLDASALARAVAVHAYDPFTNPEAHHQYPAVIISIADDGIDYRLTYGAAGIARIALRLEIRTPDGPDGERMMDDLLNAGSGASSSLFDALAADPTFGGVVADGTVQSVSAPRRMLAAEGGNTYWAASMTLLVHQPRS